MTIGRWWNRKKTIRSEGLILGVLLAGLAAAANAGIISTADCLPLHKYVKFGPPIQYPLPPPFGPVIVTDVLHANFDECNAPPGPGIGATNVETFGSSMRLTLLAPGLGINVPTDFFAPAQVSVRLTLVNDNGVVGDGNIRVFETEMLQLDISGGTLPPGVAIHESPTLASMGQTTIEDLPGGLFLIDSFFDVFTELELPPIIVPIPVPGTTDPTLGEIKPAHVELVPEPATLALFALGMLGLAGLRRGSGAGADRVQAGASRGRLKAEGVIQDRSLGEECS